MRIAVFADIQGNLPALESVLADLEFAFPDVDRFFSLGDAIGRGPFPNEVLALCRERGIDCVLGNYEDAIVNERMGSGADLASDVAEAHDLAMIEWTRGHLAADHLGFLRSMPRDLRLFPGAMSTQVRRNTGDVLTAEHQRTFLSRLAFGTLLRDRPRSPGKRVREVLLMHGTPRALNESLRQDSAQSIVGRILEAARADVMITGHGGTAFLRADERTTLIGVGSISGVEARMGIAEYAVVDLSDDTDAEFRQVTYDGERFRDEARQRGFPGSLIAL